MNRRNGRAKKSPMRKAWRFQVTGGGFSVTAQERVERAGRVALRFPDPTNESHDPRRSVQVNVRIREADGSLRPDAVRRVEEMARALHARIARDRETHDLNSLVNTLTLAEGCALAFAPSTEGPFVGSPRHRQDAIRYLNSLVRILGPSQYFDQVKPKDLVKSWKRWAEARRDTMPAAGRAQTELHPGIRCCELAFATLEKVACWLEENGYMPLNSFAMPKKWRQQLKRDWRQTVPRETAVATPRHSKEEVARLFEALHGVDPRFTLAFLISAELRIGQTLRCMRSNVNLSGDTENQNGILVVPAIGSKPSVPIALSVEQRAFLDHCLSNGYLRELEAAYASGKLLDYPIFAGGRLREGSVPVRAHIPQWNRRSALDEFHRLERLAKVKSLAGRAWYGVRRLFADLMPLHTSDNLILTLLGGHTVETRDRHYRDQDMPALLSRASQIRRSLRESLRPA